MKSTPGVLRFHINLIYIAFQNFYLKIDNKLFSDTRPSTADLLNEAERIFDTVDKANRGSQRTFSSSTNELLESAPSFVDDCKSEDGIER